jgi:methylenetetrahydrofolate reductase (NADPH)
MRNRSAGDGWLTFALRHARYEVLPTARIESVVVESVPREVSITVTASPAKGISSTLDLTSGRSELAEIVARLTSIGVTNVFCPAGDADPPAGEYEGALAMLRDLSEMGRPFAQVGITGYPESHPGIEDDVAIQSMWDKRLHATYIVSNLCFDPETIGSWIRRVRRRGVDLPVLVGLPGPVERTKLLSMATKIGVGQSMRFLGSHVGMFARIAAPGGFNPEKFLRRAASVLEDPGLRVDGLHLFTFNQVAETEHWRQDLLR